MGMFDPFERGESAVQLRDNYRTFVLLEAKVRAKIETEHGLRDAADLRVATTKPGESRLFSCFWQAIVGQIKRMDPGDLPATVRIVTIPTDNGNPTYGLELVEKPDLPTDPTERARLVAIAASMLVTPVPPLQVPDEVPTAEHAAVA
jgi:hypothetical protein